MCLAAFAFTAALAQDVPAAKDESKLTLDVPPAERQEGGDAAAGSSILPYIVRMVFVLALVIGLIYGLYAILKRSARQKNPDNPRLRVLATTGLASGRFVHIVAAGKKAWLVGSADSGVQLIAELDDKEFIDELFLDGAERNAAARFNFGDILSRMLPPRKTASEQPVSDSPIDKDFLDKQRDRLKKL